MKIGITVGDPAGIGPEIVLKSLEYLAGFATYSRHRFVVFGGLPVFKYSGIPEVERRIRHISETIPIRWVNINAPVPDAMGKSSATGGNYVAACVRTAAESAKNNEIDVMVTAPIDKVSLKMAGIKQIDHTEMLTDLFAVPFVDTLFHSKNMWIYFYSKHVALKDVAHVLRKEKLLAFIRRSIQNHRLLNLSLNKPVAVAAMNPHGSDGGRFGNEEETIIVPAVEAARKEGLPVVGPVPADSVFALHAMNKFSAVISLYHDQGHIAAKTLDFFGTVSLSLGLPLLRVSVDHGTAMEIAGKNMASPLSMIASLRLAIRYAHIYRKNFNRLS